jgi:hypothetical protein
MEIREIRGRRATTRQGAAEHLGYSDQTIELLAAKRAETGFPNPADVETEGRGVRTRTKGGKATGREWYALDDLDKFKTLYAARVDDTRGARVREPLLGDPEELLIGPEIAAALKIKSATWSSWVRDSKLDWAAGRKAYLPKPDQVDPGRRGVVRKWKRGTINTEFLPRQGKWSAAGAPEGRRVTVDDLAAVLAAGGAEQTNEDLALALTELAGRPVRLPTVSRLKKALREANS